MPVSLWRGTLVRRLPYDWDPGITPAILLLPALSITLA